MKLILIKMPLEYNELLTLGKTYDGVLESNSWKLAVLQATIIDPHTFELIHISADHFITLEEWRNKQLKEILNND